MNGKTHYADNPDRSWTGWTGHNVACGISKQSADDITDDPENVTCKRCLRSISPTPIAKDRDMSEMQPVCPKCGSISVKVERTAGECLNPDCKHVGSSGAFRPTTQRPEAISAPNAHWRDPVAMSMDGYDE